MTSYCVLLGTMHCTEHDMFWKEPFDADAVANGCQEQWGVTPRRMWATQEWGGRRCVIGRDTTIGS